MSDVTDRLTAEHDSFVASMSKPFFVNEPTLAGGGMFMPVVKVKDEKHNRMAVLGRDRICFARVLDQGDRFEAELTAGSAPNSKPCYWLPWAPDGALRVHLKPSKKDGAVLTQQHRTTKVAGSQTGLTFGADASGFHDRNIGRDVDPDLFFTGMMDGCSTWVAGDPRAPMVYHVNRKSYAAKKTLKLMEKGPASAAGVNKLKTDQMQKDFEGFHSPRTFPWQSREQALGTANPTVSQRTFPASGFDSKVWTDAGAARIHTIDSTANVSKFMNQLTAVFGIRVSGLWRFYSQEIYEYVTLGTKTYCAAAPQRFYPR